MMFPTDKMGYQIIEWDNSRNFIVQCSDTHQHFRMLHTDFPEVWLNIPSHETAPKIHEHFEHVDHDGHTKHMIVYEMFHGRQLHHHLHEANHAEFRRVLGEITCGLDFYVDKQIVPIIDHTKVLTCGRVIFTSFQAKKDVSYQDSPEDLLNPKHGNWCPIEAFRKRHVWHIGRLALKWLAARHGNKNHQKDSQLLSLYRAKLSEEDKSLLAIIDRCLMIDPAKRISLVELRMALTGVPC